MSKKSKKSKLSDQTFFFPCKILGLDKKEVDEDDYQFLLEKNTADENRIRDLLAKKESVQEMLDILNDFDNNV
jgi:hypothetical protein